MFEPPEYLSPSSIGLFRDCPQKFKLSYIDKIKEPPSWHLHLGSFVHEVLEFLYKEESHDRTLETVKKLLPIAGQTTDGLAKLSLWR